MAEVTPSNPCSEINGLEAFFTSTDGVHTIIPIPLGYSSNYGASQSGGINSKGHFVGALQPLPIDLNKVAVIYKPETGFTDLNSVSSVASGWQLSRGLSINDCGQILAEAKQVGLPQYVQKQFLLTPRATGMVFMPNPVTTSGDIALSDMMDSGTYETNSERRCVKLEGLDDSGRLQGEHVRTLSAFPVEPMQVFDYSRGGDPFSGFEQTMVYYHVDKSRRYLEELGIIPATLKNWAVRFQVNTVLKNNSNSGAQASWYAGEPGRLEFSYKGVDGAEDAMLILHEFAHLISDGLTQGTLGLIGEGGAIAEGFADYWAASAFMGSGRPGHENDLDTLFAPWFFKGFPPQYQRVLDSSKSYPQDFLLDENAVHANGEIWSAALWKIMKLVGKEKADKLFLRAFDEIKSNPTFFSEALVILDVNKKQFNGEHHKIIRDVFIEQGIVVTLSLLSVATPSVTGGNSLEGLVGLSGLAPLGGSEVVLESTNPAVIVPETVTVSSCRSPSGCQSSVSFNISTLPVLQSTTGSILATYGGVTISVSLEVTP